MFIDIFYLSLLYLEALIPILFGRKFSLGIDFSRSSPRRSTNEINVTGMTFVEEKTFLERVFLLITDNWFFNWLKTSEKSPVVISKKDSEAKVVLNNDLSQSNISILTNNVKYIGQQQKRTIC